MQRWLNRIRTFLIRWFEAVFIKIEQGRGLEGPVLVRGSLLATFDPRKSRKLNSVVPSYIKGVFELTHTTEGWSFRIRQTEFVGGLHSSLAVIQKSNVILQLELNLDVVAPVRRNHAHKLSISSRGVVHPVERSEVARFIPATL